MQQKKKLLIIAAGGGIVFMMLVAFGLLYFYTTEEPAPPAYVFASDRTGAGDIFAMTAQGELLNLTEHPATDWDPVWAADGKMLAFTSHRSGNSDIWLLDVSRSDEMATPQNLTNAPSSDYSATWSPSLRTVAFVSERDGDPEIFVQNLESDMAIQLTFNEEMDRLPAWSPDGKTIAFAAVRDGIETIHLIRPDGTDEKSATPPPLQGTAPAWAPDSQRLAFVGWDDQNRAGIYIIGPNIESVELLYQSESWLGSLDWSADGEWITFTAWESGNHEVYALPATGGAPTRLTIDEAWDDFLTIHPQARPNIAPPEGLAQAAAARNLPDNPKLAAGMNLADLSKAYLVNDLGLDWGKGYVNWGTVEPEPGQFRWIDPDNVVTAFGDQNLNILMRVHGTPAWARPEESSYTHPPDDIDDFANFMTALASRYKGQVAAYEIWNEPNLNYEWGNNTPDPAAYTEMLQAAYTAIKAIDPEALVISGGLSTTGDGSATAYGDLDFIEGMYQAGARGYFDALGSHPYPFGRPPDAVDPWGLSLARVAEQHQVMAEHNDGETPIWITEVGWALNSPWDLGEHQQTTVTEAEQAQYLAGTFSQVQRDWPFVEAVFVFNLDFSTVAWYPAAEPMRWYAILNPDRTPRPAYTALRKQMRQR